MFFNSNSLLISFFLFNVLNSVFNSVSNRVFNSVSNRVFNSVSNRVSNSVSNSVFNSVSNSFVYSLHVPNTYFLWLNKNIENTKKEISIFVYANEFRNEFGNSNESANEQIYKKDSIPTKIIDKNADVRLNKYISKYKIQKLGLQSCINYKEIHKEENSLLIFNYLNSTYPLSENDPYIWIFNKNRYIGTYNKLSYYIRDMDNLYKNIHFIPNERYCIQYIVSQNKHVYIYNNDYNIKNIKKVIRPYFYLYTFFNIDNISDEIIKKKLYHFLFLNYPLLVHGETVWKFSNGFYMYDSYV